MESVSLEKLLEKREAIVASRENLKMQLGGHDGAIQILDELIEEAKRSAEGGRQDLPAPIAGNGAAVPRDETADKQPGPSQKKV